VIGIGIGSANETETETGKEIGTDDHETIAMAALTATEAPLHATYHLTSANGETEKTTANGCTIRGAIQGAIVTN
jgi:hypothetical protein